MTIKIDTTGWSLDDTIPEGQYDAVLLNVEESVSRAGNAMLTWTFVLVSGPHAGREFRTYTVLSEASAWKLQEVLSATGLGKIGSSLSLEYDQYVNTRVVLEIQDGEFQGNLRSEIRRVHAPEEGAGVKFTGNLPYSSPGGPSIDSGSSPDDDLPF